MTTRGQAVMVEAIGSALSREAGEESEQSVT
jgi:hypothetical protein